MPKRDETYIEWGVRIAKQKNKFRLIVDLACEAIWLYGKPFRHTTTDGVLIQSRVERLERGPTVVGLTIIFAKPPDTEYCLNLKHPIPKQHRALVEKAMARFCFELGVILKPKIRALERCENRLLMSIQALGGLPALRD